MSANTFLRRFFEKYSEPKPRRKKLDRGPKREIDSAECAAQTENASSHETGSQDDPILMRGVLILEGWFLALSHRDPLGQMKFSPIGRSGSGFISREPSLTFLTRKEHASGQS